MIDTILFDLDATLVPLEQDIFIEKYMAELAKKAISCGYDKNKALKGIMLGCKSMLENDGSKSNRDVFWDVFLKFCGDSALELEPIFDKFYGEEFNTVSNFITKKRSLRGFFEYLKTKGYTLILATNPLFPHVASVSRLSWVDLKPDDFAYVSTYENSSFSKPNIGFFNEILHKTNKAAKNCMMVGNNAVDDMCVIKHFGMEAFLVTDFLENSTNLDISQFRHGTMNDLMKFFGYEKLIG